MGDLVKSVIHATNKLKQTQDTYQDAAMTLQQTINTYDQQIDQLVDEIHGIKQILREGFRLPLTDKEN
jgi:peptidoglycan hydrolase CwlO-like protein